MKWIGMNLYKSSLLSGNSKTIRFLRSYCCAQKLYPGIALQSKAAITVTICIQHDPVIAHLPLDFVGNIFHSTFQNNTHGN